MIRRKPACACGGACPRCKPAGAQVPVSQPGDRDEHDANRVADQVMQMTDSGSASVDQVMSTGAFAAPVQRTGHGGGPSVARERITAGLRGGGKAMPASERAFFEPRFGRAFDTVRIHDGPAAAAAANAVNARAFTLGNDIAFARGEYAPGTVAGRRLIAHELTHTLQQAQGGVRLQRDLDAGVPDAGVPGAGPSDAGPSDAGPALPGGVGGGPTDAGVGESGAADAGPTDAGSGGGETGGEQRICGPDITSSLNTMLGTVGPWFRSQSTFRKRRSCMGLGPLGPLALVNPIMAWDTRELFLPNTGWLDAYRLSHSCGSPQDSRCATDRSRHTCELSSTCGNSVVVGGKCMLAGTANYALFGKICRLCHDETGQWGRWDMRAIITAWKAIGDDPTPPKEVASAAYDGTFPTLPTAAENRGTCTGRCGQSHGGTFHFIWEPYQSR